MLRVQQELIDLGWDATIISAGEMKVKKPGLQRVGRQQVGWRAHPEVDLKFDGTYGRSYFYYKLAPWVTVETVEDFVKAYDKVTCVKSRQAQQWITHFRPVRSRL